jgi:hypothetical protein
MSGNRAERLVRCRKEIHYEQVGGAGLASQLEGEDAFPGGSWTGGSKEHQLRRSLRRAACAEAQDSIFRAAGGARSKCFQSRVSRPSWSSDEDPGLSHTGLRSGVSLWAATTWCAVQD